MEGPVDITNTDLLSFFKEFLPPIDFPKLEELEEVYLRNGWYDHAVELDVARNINTLVQYLKPEIIFETGTFMGHSTFWMAKALETNGRGKIYTIDLPQTKLLKGDDGTEFAIKPTRDFLREQTKKLCLEDYIEFLEGYSYECDLAALGLENRIDLAFIDSQHDWVTVHKEFMLFYPNLKPNGWMIFHDTLLFMHVMEFLKTRKGIDRMFTMATSLGRGLTFLRKGM